MSEENLTDQTLAAWRREDELIKKTKQIQEIMWDKAMDLVKEAVKIEREELIMICELAEQATKDAKEQLRQDEFMSHGVAAGAIHQAKQFKQIIMDRNKA